MDARRRGALAAAAHALRVSTTAEAWIDLVLRRSAEMRRAGILSIGCDGKSAVLAPAEPDIDTGKGDDPPAETAEPANVWENPVSYPSGHVPELEIDKGELPEIPQFDDA
jgi:acyl transferase domain-containing protein